MLSKLSDCTGITRTCEPMLITVDARSVLARHPNGADTDELSHLNVQTPGVHHVALRCTDLARARLFYVDRLGFPVLLEVEDMFIFAAGQTAFVVRSPGAKTASSDAFDPFRVGLDHIALGCADTAELHRVADALATSGIESTGVKRDLTLGKEYVAFKDPDGIQWQWFGRKWTCVVCVFPTVPVILTSQPSATGTHHSRLPELRDERDADDRSPGNHFCERAIIRAPVAW